MRLFSINPNIVSFPPETVVKSERKFALTIVPGVPMKDQILAQVSGIDAEKDEELILHPIPGVGTSAIAFFRGKNHNLPKIRIVGPDRKDVGGIDLHDFRHNVARPRRAEFLATDDEVAANAVIVVNASGREVPAHQADQIMKLTKSSELVVATLQLGQVNLTRSDLKEWILEILISALKDAGIGNSIATRRVVAITAGLAPVNATIVTALHALCESWCSQPVAENQAGVFNFTDLIELSVMEDLGRNAMAAAAPVIINRESLKLLIDAAAELHALRVQKAGSAMEDGDLAQAIAEADSLLK